MNKQKVFKIGQVIKCVNPTGYLVKGEDYTVKSIVSNEITGEEVGVVVKECSNKVGFNSYRLDRFKALREVTVTILEDDLLLLLESAEKYSNDANSLRIIHYIRRELNK